MCGKNGREQLARSQSAGRVARMEGNSWRGVSRLDVWQEWKGTAGEEAVGWTCGKNGREKLARSQSAGRVARMEGNSWRGVSRLDVWQEWKGTAGEKSVGWTCGKNGRKQVMKRADTLRVEGRRRRGRPRLILDDCTETDLVGVGGKWERSGWEVENKSEGLELIGVTINYIYVMCKVINALKQFRRVSKKEKTRTEVSTED